MYSVNLKKFRWQTEKKLRCTEKKFRCAGPEIFLRFETDLNFSRPRFSEIKVQIKWPMIINNRSLVLYYLYSDPHGIWVAFISHVLIVEAPLKVKSNMAVSVDPELPISTKTGIGIEMKKHKEILICQIFDEVQKISKSGWFDMPLIIEEYFWNWYTNHMVKDWRVSQRLDHPS